MAASPYHSARGGLLPHLFIVHSTRSGASHDDATERAGTLGWFRSNPQSVSAHYVADAEGGLTPVVSLERSAHHDSARNPISVGIELTQATPTTPFQSGHYEATALAFRLTNAWLRGRGAPPIPARRVFSAQEPGLIGHEDSQRGKSDPGKLFDWQKLMALLNG